MLDLSGYVVAYGYIRVVYGDHGPYVECDRRTVNFGRYTRVERHSKWRYYDAWMPTSGALGSNAKLYDQLRTAQSEPSQGDMDNQK